MKKITSKDIALKANVSQATVSYVLNNTPGKSISEDTRKRILDAVEEMNYIPNSAARRLKSDRSYCIAVRLGTTLSTPRYHNAVQGIRSYLAPRGYNILLCGDQKRENTFDFISACLNTQADGIIYVASDNSDISPDALAQIKKHKIPFSVIDCMSDDPAVNSVCYDYFASSYLRADCLLNKGFKKFIYIRPEYENTKETARERGFHAVMLERRNLESKCIFIESVDMNSSLFSQHSFSGDISVHVYGLLKQLVNETSPDTCFICSSREVQQIVSQKLYAQYIQTPLPQNEKWYERSISYHFPHYNAGFEAARSLLNMINDPKEIRKLTLQPVIEPVDPAYY